MPSLTNSLRSAVVMMEETDVAIAYAERHKLRSAAILTILTDELAYSIAMTLAPRIGGKTVVEVGGGIGLLAFYLADYAKRVFCIEANPMWSSAFVKTLYNEKPKNLSYLFGAADEFADVIRGDIALFCAHSGIASLNEAGRLFAPLVIDVYGEMIAHDPDRYDPLARKLRPFV